MTLPANPLAAIVAAAAKKLPVNTGATAIGQTRLDNPALILADVSSSMAEPAGARRKIDILQSALAGVREAGSRVVAFSAMPADIPAGAPLPEPSGSTALHLALASLRRRRPARVILISDGRPDDEERAIEEADALGASIDVIYCGPDSDHRALAFMRRLAARTRGRLIVRDIARAQPTAIAADIGRLALPAAR